MRTARVKLLNGQISLAGFYIIFGAGKYKLCSLYLSSLYSELPPVVSVQLWRVHVVHKRSRIERKKRRNGQNVQAPLGGREEVGKGETGEGVVVDVDEEDGEHRHIYLTTLSTTIIMAIITITTNLLTGFFWSYNIENNRRYCVHENRKKSY